MEKYRKTEILQIVEEEGVEFIRLQFTDMFGTLKNVAVPVSCLEKAMDDRCTIDLASLNGFATVSYTHLDVYKRQFRIHIRAVMWISRSTAF